MHVTDFESLAIFFYLLSVLLVGLSFGSFYTALASRILYYFYGAGRKLYTIRTKHPKSPYKTQRIQHKLWQAILFSPSFCFDCHKKIRPYDLVPIWSYLYNRARCRHCQNPISIWHLLGECYGGALLLLLFNHTHNWLTAIAALCFCGHLYIAFLTDWRYYILDPENTLCLFLWALIYLGSKYQWDINAMQNQLIAFTGALLCFALLSLLTRFRGLGLGDVLLASAIALFMGLPNCLYVFIMGALLSIFYIVLYKKDLRIPAPLGAGMAFALLLLFPIELLWSFLETYLEAIAFYRLQHLPL